MLLGISLQNNKKYSKDNQTQKYKQSYNVIYSPYLPARSHVYCKAFIEA
jgi:hypothetical protein